MRSVRAMQQADLLIIAGTSLAVYPAAGLLRYYEGEHTVVINRSPTPMDEKADLLFSEKVGEVLTQVQQILQDGSDRNE